ncbi:hypothetical protein FB451DRAFT_1561364, partial [Mycena latifolia]
MSSSATFCNIPVSTSFNPESERSLLAVGWILSSGISTRGAVASGALSLPCNGSRCTMHMDLAVTSDLPYDIVLGRDWSFLCRETLPNAFFDLSSGVVCLGPRTGSSQNASQTCPMDVDAEPVAQVQGVLSERSQRVCDCDELSACRCPSTSSSVRHPEFMTPMTSLNIIRDVFLGHHATRSRISVFHADLQTIHRALDLHAIPYLNLTLIECRQVLIH